MTNILANELNMLFFYFVNVHMYTYLAFVMLVAIIVHPLHHRDSQSLLYILS